MKLDLQEVDEFLASNKRCAWVNVGVYRVYLRRAFHLIEGKIENTLDLANVVKDDGPYGGFWEIFSGLCKRGQEMGIKFLYLENTYNERLHQAYVQRGCIPILGPDPSLFKRL